MANGYDAHSLKMTALAAEAASGDMPVGLRTAVRDKRFTRSGIGYRTQKESTSLNPGAVGQAPPPIMYPNGYASGVATGRRGMQERGSTAWETAQEAASPPIRPRAMLERSGLLEALPPWLRGKGEEEKEALPPWLRKDGDEKERKEAAAQFVRENMGAFPCEEEARIALAVLSQFVDGDTLDNLQQAIEDQYGDPMEQPEGEDWEDYPDDMPPMMEGGLREAPLDAQKRNALDSSDFALPGRRYPIDTPARARAALARVKQFGKEGEEAKVKAAVKKKYPNMEVE